MSIRSIAFAVACVVLSALIVEAQTTRPNEEGRLAKSAAELGLTPAGLQRLVNLELGEPLFVDGDLIVGLHRDADGHVSGVQITSSTATVILNRKPKHDKPALEYTGWSATDAPSKFYQTTDLDGDGRIDQMMVPSQGKSPPMILLRTGTAFLPVTGVGNGRFKHPDGRLVEFDYATREWRECATPQSTTRPTN